MPVKQRIVGYDIAKSLAMLFVVILHYSFYTRYYSSGIAGTLVTTLCVVCVPLFFAVNGALLLPRPLDVRKHCRKLATIVVVLAVWKTIVALFFVFVDGTHPVTIKDFLIFQLGGGFGEYPTGYFWFMNALIAVYLVYPLIKLMFDDGRRVALWTTLGVLFAFTVGKDTVTVLLDALGAATHHDLSSVLGSLPEFYIFGSYGYVMLYFVVGGLIGRRVRDAGTPDGESVDDRPRFRRHSARDRRLSAERWPFVHIGPLVAGALILLCYVLSFGIQRLQHAVKGTNLTIDYGYWLLPTFVATVLALALCLHWRVRSPLVRGAAECVGRNTFGVYMLHMMAITVFAKAQAHPALAAVFASQAHSGWVVTLMNVACVLVLFVFCLVVSVVMRKIPVVRTLFTV